MGNSFEDRFVVFVRGDSASCEGPEAVERELVSCSTYEEADWVRHEYGQNVRRCVIRYLGPAGGGD